MQVYDPPLRDMRFVLHELHEGRLLAAFPPMPSSPPISLDAVLEEAGRLSREECWPRSTAPATRRCRIENGVVRTPAGFKAAYDQFREGGWCALAADPKWGGQGLPESINKLVGGDVRSANISFSLYPGLTHGAHHRDRGLCRCRPATGLYAQDGGGHLVRHHVPDRGALRATDLGMLRARAVRRRRTAATRCRAPRSSSRPASTT